MIKSRLVLQWWIGRLLSSEGVASASYRSRMQGRTGLVQGLLKHRCSRRYVYSKYFTQETGSAISAIGRLFDGFYPWPHASNGVTCLGGSCLKQRIGNLLLIEGSSCATYKGMTNVRTWYPPNIYQTSIASAYAYHKPWPYMPPRDNQ